MGECIVQVLGCAACDGDTTSARHRDREPWCCKPYPVVGSRSLCCRNRGSGARTLALAIFYFGINHCNAITRVESSASRGYSKNATLRTVWTHSSDLQALHLSFGHTPFE